jgi:hypothetical protein
MPCNPKIVKEATGRGGSVGKLRCFLSNHIISHSQLARKHCPACTRCPSAFPGRCLSTSWEVKLPVPTIVHHSTPKCSKAPTDFHNDSATTVCVCEMAFSTANPRCGMWGDTGGNRGKPLQRNDQFHHDSEIIPRPGLTIMMLKFTEVDVPHRTAPAWGGRRSHYPKLRGPGLRLSWPNTGDARRAIVGKSPSQLVKRGSKDPSGNAHDTRIVHVSHRDVEMHYHFTSSVPNGKPPKEM